jgi:predicted PurR-regulated permease PerM
MAQDIAGQHRANSRAALRQVPVPLEVGAQWAWRLIVIGIVAIALMSMIATFSALLVPLAVALLIAAPLERIVGKLHRKGWSRGLAALTILLGLIVTVLGLLAAAGREFVSSYDDLKVQARDGLDRIIGWLASSPLNVDPAKAQDYIDHIGDTISANRGGLVSGALSVTATVGALAAGALIALICLFFFLRDGRRLWIPIVRLFPKAARDDLDRAGTAAWSTLAAFTKTSVFVALIDAVGIGLGAWILGLPLALPIGILVFLGSFIPSFGSLITGLMATLIALVDGGVGTALIMLGIVMVVQQVEGNVLYPWLFGKEASIHPLAIILALSVGTIVAGIPGALLAVPALAVAKAFYAELRDEPEDNSDDGLDVTRAIRVRRWSARRR